MADKKMKPPYFRVRLSSVGTDKGFVDHQTMYDKNARELLKNAMCTVADDLVGNERYIQLIFDTCIEVLDIVMKDESKEKTVKEMIDNLYKNAWTIVEPGKGETDDDGT